MIHQLFLIKFYIYNNVADDSDHLKDLTFPYVCDQLTAVRFEKAKKCRAGDDTDPSRQFHCIDPS